MIDRIDDILYRLLDSETVPPVILILVAIFFLAIFFRV